MQLWKIYRDEAIGCNEYASAIVAAETEQNARMTHPCWYGKEPWDGKYHDMWQEADCITVKLIGDAKKGTKAGVILASFNAG